MNNFQQLLEEQERRFDGERKHKVQQGLLQSFGAFRLVGHLIGVYLPAMANVIVTAIGGHCGGEQKPSRSINQPPSLGDSSPGRQGPEAPQDLDILR